MNHRGRTYTFTRVLDIDSVDDTLSSLSATVGGSREMVLRAQGALVFPSVATAAIYIGSAYGEVALR